MIGQTLVLRYRIEEKLGEGGMGIVYIASDLRLGRTIALKMLRPELLTDPFLQKRLSTEAKVASALNHSCIATLYDFETGSEGSFLIYEFINGRTLRVVQAEGSLDLSELLSIYIAIATGISVAHEAGIVHRDLKPENVMIREDGQVKILDFGLAKFSTAPFEGKTLATSGTLPGLLLGTVPYMSPEQLEGEKVDHRSDIFSIGTMLFEAVTGQHPFMGRSAGSTIGNILKEEPREPVYWPPGAHPELERIIRKCLRKKKEERYQSAMEVVVDLEAVRRDLQGTGTRGRAIGASGAGYELPVKIGQARVLFQLLQFAYLAVYAATLRWAPDNPVLAFLSGDFVEGMRMFIVVAAMCGIATRIYLMSAVGWKHRDAGKKFLWLFPWLVVFDGLLWGASPILLWERLHELSLFFVAVMAYLPFGQRTLIRTIYPGVTVRISSRGLRPAS